MRNLILGLMVFGLVGVGSQSAQAGKFYGISPISVTSSSVTMNVSGDIKIAASSSTPTSYVIKLEGGSGKVTATDFVGALLGNVTGNADTVTTNANLTGNVTSVGNATTIAVIPAVSGASLTSLTATNISAGSLGSEVIASSVAVGAVVNSVVATGIDAIKIGDGTVSNTEFEYSSTTTGNIQDQFDALPSGDYVLKAGDTMTGQLTTTSSMTAQNMLLGNYIAPTLTFQGNNANNGGRINFKESDGTLKFKLLNYVAQDELYMYNDFAVVQTWTQDNKVGIMNTNPTHTLDVVGGGIFTSSVTASEFYGDGSNLTGIEAGDNLGNHIATTTLNMATNDIENGGTITATSLVGALTGNADTATSVPASGVDLSTVTTRFELVATDTTTLQDNIDLKLDITGTGSSLTAITPANISDGTLGAGVLQVEWDTAYGWGDHSVPGYLTSYTETDPIYINDPAFGITATNISNWGSAYGWGNHASGGYADASTVATDTTTIAGNVSDNSTAIDLKVAKAGDTMTGALVLDQPSNGVGGILDLRGDFAAGNWGTINFKQNDTDVAYYQMIANNTDGFKMTGTSSGRMFFGAKSLVTDVYNSSVLISSYGVIVGTTSVGGVGSGNTLYSHGNIKANTSVEAENFIAQGYSGLSAVCDTGEILSGGAFVVGIATAGTCATAPTTSGNITWDGKQVWENKVGFGYAPFDGLSYPANDDYGIWLSTPVIASEKITWHSMTSPFMKVESGGLSAQIQGTFASGKNGFTIYDDDNTWNGRLELGVIYGPDLYGKGAIGAPLLGINNDTPTHAVDITGGLIASSSITATGGFYGDGSNLTGIEAGDNLGNHIATTTLNMATNDIDSIGDLDVGGNTNITGTLGVTGILSADAGIKFPASISASTDVNTLDDYEEGDWTPIIGGSTSESEQTYYAQYGKYTKIGRVVILNFRVYLNVKGTILGDLQIKGVPFSAASYAGLALGYTEKLSVTAGHIPTGHIQSGYPIRFYETDFTGDTPTVLSASSVTNGTRITGTLTYFTND